MTFLKYILAAGCLFSLMGSAVALEKRETTNTMCQEVASRGGAKLWYANAALDSSQVRITYVSHSTFRIEDAAGIHIATDYNGFIGAGVTPNVVTMNHAHDTHYTDAPDPNIEHVMKGWTKDGVAAKHHVQIGEAIIRNVTTDIKPPFGEFEADGNSIFIYEVGGLCIGHLGHLHELPSDEDYAKIGRLDVVMVPVGGGVTMKLRDMLEVVERLNARIVMPMHWMDKRALFKFLDVVEDSFALDGRNEGFAILSVSDLPKKPTMLVLTPETSFPLFKN